MSTTFWEDPHDDSQTDIDLVLPVDKIDIFMILICAVRLEKRKIFDQNIRPYYSSLSNIGLYSIIMLILFTIRTVHYNLVN